MSSSSATSRNIRSSTKSRALTLLERNTLLFSSTSCQRKKMAASELSLVSSLLKMLVLVLFIVPQALERTIMPFAFRIISFSQEVLSCPWTMMVDSRNLSKTTKANTSRTPIQSLSRTSKKKEDLLLQELLPIVIHSVGDHRDLSCTELLTPGSLRLLKSRTSCSRTMRIQSGCQKLFRRRDSKTGSKMQETGASQETDTGVTQFHCGALTTWRKSFALAQLRSSRNFLAAVKSLISTESSSMISQFLLNKAKESSGESQRSSTAGLKVDLCHTLRVTILSQLLTRTS